MLIVFRFQISTPSTQMQSGNFQRNKKKLNDHSKRLKKVGIFHPQLQPSTVANFLHSKVCYALRLRLIEFADRPDILAQMAKRALDDAADKAQGPATE